MVRFLRPSVLRATSDAVWAVDDVQPVAARLDPVDGAVLDVLDWPSLPAPAVGDRRRVESTGDQVWVRQGEVVGRLDHGGLRATADVPGTRLMAAGGPGAWLAEQRYVPPGAPDRTLPDGRIVLLDADDRRREIRLDRPVWSLAADPDALLVTVTMAAPVAVSTGRNDYHRETFRLPWDDLPTAAIRCADQARFITPWGIVGVLPPAPGSGHRAAGLWWNVGCEGSPPRPLTELPGLAVGVDDDGVERARVPLGLGIPCGITAVGDQLWIAVRRGLQLAGDPAAPVEIVVLDPRTHRVATALPADRIDITGLGWPLPSEPPDSAAHAERVLRRWQEMVIRPPAVGMTDVRVVLDGQWPGRVVRVTFRHPYYPDGEMVRRIPLFDELGRAVDPGYADVTLMEDLDTRFLPPISHAHDGVLDV